MDKKDIVLIITAVVTLASGITLAFLSFFLSLEHEITNSVLWYFAQCLLYCGASFGLLSYLHVKLDNIQIQINKANEQDKDN